MQLSRINLSKGAAVIGLVGALGGSALIFPFSRPVVFTLEQTSGETGQAVVTIDDTQLSINVTGAAPDSLYTVWVDFRNRGTLLVPPDYPAGAVARGVAPAFPSTQGVTAGMGMDRNAFMTDGQGNATFSVALDYELLKPGDSPVVHANLSMQGSNLVGGQWMRAYADDAQASLQLVDPTTGLPVLRRSTAQGLTIQRHPDKISHGHTPGVGGVDHFGAWKGDFPQ